VRSSLLAKMRAMWPRVQSPDTKSRRTQPTLKAMLRTMFADGAIETLHSTVPAQDKQQLLVRGDGSVAKSRARYDPLS
jgi:hypothetical protein